MNHTQLLIGIVSRLLNTQEKLDLPGAELLKQEIYGYGYQSILPVSGLITGAAEVILSTFSAEK